MKVKLQLIKTIIKLYHQNDAVTNSNKINYGSYPKISTGINSQEYVSGTGSIGAIFAISVDEIELDVHRTTQYQVGFKI